MASENRIFTCRPEEHPSVAVFALTSPAFNLAKRIQSQIPNVICYVSEKILYNTEEALINSVQAIPFKNIGEGIGKAWNEKFSVIVCIMATGIVVRSIAPLIKDKRTDPAVLVIDEAGAFVISLLAGHIGGANYWARRIASAIGAIPVITTASDVRGKPALDVMALQKGCTIIESQKGYGSLACVMRRLLDGEKVHLYDPESLVLHELVKHYPSISPLLTSEALSDKQSPGIWVSEKICPHPNWVVIVPRNLIVGVGCNRGTEAQEIIDLITRVFDSAKMMTEAIRCIVSIDIKSDEPGLAQAARYFGCPLFFQKQAKLANVRVPNPSDEVKKHIGVTSVCEAAALTFHPKAQLVIPKRKTRNVTVAVAKVPFH